MSRIAKLSLAILAVSLAACSGKDGAAGTNGHSTLVLVVNEPAGAHCAEGGVAIEQGVDTNGNGVLDATEVNVAETVYVCNGAMGDAGTGAPGSNGAVALVKVTTEPPGSNCQYGGERIDSGIDTNGDGMLETAEITSTSYVCNGNNFEGYHFGDIYIFQPADFAQLDGVTHLVGNLIIEGTLGVGYAVSLPGLLTVTGTIGLDGQLNDDRHNGAPAGMGIASVSFPDLTSVSQINMSAELALTSVSLPALTSVGQFDLYDDPALTTLDLSSLAQVASTLEIDYSGLTTFALPALAYANVLNLYSNGSMTSLSMPKLVAVNSMYLEEMPALTSLSLPLLAEVPEELDINNCHALTTLSFPLLTSVYYFDIDAETALASLAAPLLTQANQFYVYENPLLSSCAVSGIFAQLSPAPTGSNISGNLPNTSYCTWPKPTAFTVTGITDPLYYGSTAYDFDDAEAGCRTLGTGGHLMWFESAGEVTAFQGAVTAATSVMPTDSWVGYTDATDATTGVTTTEGTFVALSGYTAYDPTTPIDGSIFWNSGEPNGGTVENCAELYAASGLANDTTCSSALSFVCRVPAAAPARNK